jgi:hypothetical protein
VLQTDEGEKGMMKRELNERFARIAFIFGPIMERISGVESNHKTASVSGKLRPIYTSLELK